MSEYNKHISVFLKEATESLIGPAHLNKQAIIVDATLGAGGHTRELLRNGVKVIAFEADSKIFEMIKPELLDFIKNEGLSSDRLRVINRNFVEMSSVLKKLGYKEVDGVLFDFGISTMHYFDIKRGFSFSKGEEDLDMRINPKSQNVTASDLLNALSLNELTEMFLTVLDYRKARKISEEIVGRRKEKRIEKVSELAKICMKVIKRKGKTDPSTKPFLALRIFVNSEIQNVKLGLEEAFKNTRVGGRISAISFHSLEDKQVKNFVKKGEKMGILKEINKITEPGPAEIAANPRARSACLRIIEKI